LTIQTKNTEDKNNVEFEKQEQVKDEVLLCGFSAPITIQNHVNCLWGDGFSAPIRINNGQCWIRWL